MTVIIDKLEKQVAAAVSHYWQTRKAQRDRQKQRGISDAGLRSAVTGGAQMDGFINLFERLIVDSGINSRYIFRKKALELPGFFRPTKEWDLLVVKDGYLLVAIEAKSQVGPSFGNNFNNRTEEAMEAPSIYGQHLERAHLMAAFNRSLAIFLCWTIVKLPNVL